MSFKPIQDFEALLDDPLVPELTSWSKFINPSASTGIVASSWDGLTYAFKSALEAVFEEHFKRAHIDLLEYPLAYLARHYIELSLKSVWARCQSEGLLDSDPPWTHSLAEIWTPVRKTLVEAGISAFEDDFSKSFEKTLEHFDDVDRKSDGFRYPATNPARLRSVDSSLLAQELDRVTVFFYGLDAIMDQRQEFLQWQRDL